MCEKPTSEKIEIISEIIVRPGFEKNAFCVIKNNEIVPLEINVVFPVMHGPNCEDGSLQGLLTQAGIPYVGPKVLSSAIGMDKDIMKRLLRDANIPVTDFLVYKKHEIESISFELVKNKLGLPFFVKPANMGSSIGISRVMEEKDFSEAIKNAFLHDSKIIIERAVMGREIECSVIGNNFPVASFPGEIVTVDMTDDFYSYDAKYIDVGVKLDIPARLFEEKIAEIQALAIKTYQVLECSGMSRVDLFLEPSGKILVNEINTIPGFTNISMFPKMMEATGIKYTELITKLVEFAREI